MVRKSVSFRPGGSQKKQQRRIGNPHTARNAIAVNFERMASATLAPSRPERSAVGRLIHRQNQRRAAGRVATRVMSVIARPAWPNTGGVELNSRTAIHPAVAPKTQAAQAQTTMQETMKNGK